MLFSETIDQVKKEVDEAVEELFLNAKLNQTHRHDLLLVLLHGFRNEDFIEYADKNNLSHYMFGPSTEGWAEHTHYEFYNAYRHNLFEEDRVDFIEKVKIDEDLQFRETMSIHLEMMVYLKFWESDMIVKRLYQLSRLACGEGYDWHFRIKNFKGRQAIFREQIRNKTKEITPKFSSLIEELYSNQIRNSIGHSQYSFLGRNIHLNNEKENKYHRLKTITFDDWEVIIHKVIMAYDSLIGQVEKNFKKYIKEVEGKHFGLDVQVPKKYGGTKLEFINYLPDQKRWRWYKNISRH